MSPLIKNLLTAGAVVTACGAVVIGTAARDQADLHLRSFSPFATNSHSLLASLSNTVPEVTASDYYESVTELLKTKYVDPITDERKLATGGVKGMVMSLNNPDCFFMDPKEFKAHSEEAMGRFQGIGVQLAFHVPTRKLFDSEMPGASGGEMIPVPLSGIEPDKAAAQLPALVVDAVVPGSPADKAGVRAGDSVDDVNGYWVMNPYDLDRFALVQKMEKDGKIPIAQYLAVRKDLRKKLSASMAPIKAKDLLILGTTGNVKIVWNRHGQMLSTTIGRSITNEDAVRKLANGSISVHFLPGAAAHLKAIVPSSGATLDLRNNDFGSLAEMKDCLALFAPSGVYGEFANYKKKPGTSFNLKDGHKPRGLTLVVDGSTGGVAEIFALALKSKGYATIQGPPMASDRNVVETIKLADGSGYTLVTGEYQAPSAKRSS